MFIWLYQDYESAEKFSITEDQISHLLPACCQDMIVRVYSKKPDLVCPKLYVLFNKFFKVDLLVSYGFAVMLYSHRWKQFLRPLRIFKWRHTGWKLKCTRLQRRRNAPGITNLQCFSCINPSTSNLCVTFVKVDIKCKVDRRQARSFCKISDILHIFYMSSIGVISRHRSFPWSASRIVQILGGFDN